MFKFNKAPNYSRQFERWTHSPAGRKCAKTLAIAAAGGKDSADKIARNFEFALESIRREPERFVLPHNSQISEDSSAMIRTFAESIYGDEGEFMLEFPFDTMCLEFTTDAKDMDTNELMPGAARPYIIIIDRLRNYDETPEGKIDGWAVYNVSKNDNSPLHMGEWRDAWMVAPPLFIPRHQVLDGEIGDSFPIRIHAPNTTVGFDQKTADVVASESWSTIGEFLAFINCSNVDTTTRKSPGSIHHKKKNPLSKNFDSYRLLSLKSDNSPIGSYEIGEMGDRRRSRQHVRRGHIRHYKSGRTIWINSMVVNRDVKNKITKDYEVKSVANG